MHIGLFGWFDNLVSWMKKVFGHGQALRDQAIAPDPLNLPPIPEPSTWLLMLAGVVLVLLVARRRKRRERALNFFDTQWMRDR